MLTPEQRARVLTHPKWEDLIAAYHAKEAAHAALSAARRHEEEVGAQWLDAVDAALATPEGENLRRMEEEGQRLTLLMWQESRQVRLATALARLYGEPEPPPTPVMVRAQVAEQECAAERARLTRHVPDLVTAAEEATRLAAEKAEKCDEEYKQIISLFIGLIR